MQVNLGGVLLETRPGSPVRDLAGVTLLELVFSLGLFTLLLVILTLLFTQTLGVWRKIDSADTADREIRKAVAALRSDLQLASPSRLNRTQVPPSLGAGNDGEALWFLSPIATSGQMAHKQDSAEPLWQRNILYYLVVPQNHNPTFGMNCSGIAGPTGYEAACSHKVLIRKVIDSGVATVPTDESTEETLIADITPYLTHPNGYDLSGMNEPGVEHQEIVASRLLTFESQNAGPSEVSVELRAVALQDAQRETRLGSVSMYTGRFTAVAPFSVFLKN
ncbi:MAG: hypothetical protein HY319_06300 [Armatimonadetes bacterium]|nr:hypothetical protein [Armatimonadota bacterium]